MKNQKEKPQIIKTLYCPHCNKKIKGFEGQAENNLAIHIMTQHKELLKRSDK